MAPASSGYRSRRSVARGKKITIILVIVALLVVFRLLLPVIVLHFANKSLANVKGYYGHIEDIDMSLYRGAYQVKN
ncbi:MAG TPA: hypothetical protein VEZ17_06125, partial [Chitinophagaceae bacterium]|nr:hypothetical protein [Chitinophagaceae bacterium]